MSMSGLWIIPEVGWNFIDEYKKEINKSVGHMPGRLKWQKVPTYKDHPYMKWYTALIDIAFEYIKANKIGFRSLIVDKSDYDMKKEAYTNGDCEVGFYRLYYYLLLHRLRPNNEYHIRLAERMVSPAYGYAESDYLTTLKDCLNNGARKKYGYRFDDDLVVSIESRSEKDRILFWTVDVIMGAIGFHWNDLHTRENCKPGKLFLADYIAQKLEWENLCYTTPATSKKYFDIFHFTPRK